MLFCVLIQCFKNITEFKIFGRQIFEILLGFTGARLFKLHLFMECEMHVLVNVYCLLC